MNPSIFFPCLFFIAVCIALIRYFLPGILMRFFYKEKNQSQTRKGMMMSSETFTTLSNHLQMLLFASTMLGVVSLLLAGFRLEAKSTTRSQLNVMYEMIHSYIATYISGWREQKLVYTCILALIVCLGWLMFIWVIVAPSLKGVKHVY